MKKMSNEQHRAILTADGLKNDGLSWEGIAEQVNALGLRGAKGGAWTQGSIQKAYSRAHTAGLIEQWRRADSLETTEPQVPTKTDNVACGGTRHSLDSEPSPVKDDDVYGLAKSDEHDRVGVITRGEVMALLADLEKRLTSSDTMSANDDKLDEPPMPPKTGKRYHGSKGDIRVRCDSFLVERFNADVGKRFGGNASRAMDAVLWHFYGRPVLSFQSAQQADVNNGDGGEEEP